MCSVTWSLSETGYQVFFNRDEQKSRALALAPAIYDRQGVSHDAARSARSGQLD